MSHFCTISVYNNLSLLGWTRNRCTGCSSAVTFCHDRCHQINHSWNLLVFKGVITPQNCIYVDVVARPSALHTNLCGRSGVKGVAIWSLSLTLPSVHPTLSAITLISSQQVTVTVFHSATTRFHGKQSKATGTEKHSAEQTHWNKLSSTDRSVSWWNATHTVFIHTDNDKYSVDYGDMPHQEQATHSFSFVDVTLTGAKCLFDEKKITLKMKHVQISYWII